MKGSPPGPPSRSFGQRARTAARAIAPSDVTRVRDLALAALVAVVTLVATLALARPGEPGLSPGSLVRPHAQAKLGCAACHARTDVPGGAPGSCVGCHASSAHASTRAGHRELVVRGVLRCVGCHAAHGTAEGVTFLEDRRFIRWGGGEEEVGAGVSGPPGASVPLVPLSACAGCHDPARVSDPLAACVAGGGASPRFSRCFDEHQRVVSSPPASTGPDRGTSAGLVRSVCDRQHGASRFVAWEAAAEVARRVPGFLSSASSPARWGGGAAFALLAGAVAFVSIGAARRRLRIGAQRARAAAPPEVVPGALPHIDPSTCLGCFACVDACPFDVLEIQRYVAVVARPSACCGVVLCQQVCPNGSLTIAERPPIEQRVRLGENLESLDAPGVYVAGDLGGLPLIKNAILQGVRSIDGVAASLPRGRRRVAGTFDVAIIGAGPAGLSASLRAQELGLSYVTLEQGSIASSIQSFPRNKLVFDQPLNLPVEGDLWLRECTKEELLAQWTRIARRRKLAIREGQRVLDIERTLDGHIALHAEGPGAEPRVVASRLVLAIGKRGTPRKLEALIDPDAVGKVYYSLADARSFTSQRVLIVGLGDSAMEAAVALARQPGTTVTLSYRGKDFTRGAARNVAEVKALVQKRKIRLLLESRVARVTRETAVLEAGGRREELPNDAVLAFLGGVPAWDLVKRAGVRIASHAVLDEAGASAPR